MWGFVLPLIASILILTIISLIPSSFAQVLYSDNFDDNDISEYQQFGGSWTTVLESGTDYVLRHTSNSNTVVFPQSESFSNSYQVIAEIWNEDNDAGGVAFGIDPLDPDNLYSCSASSDSAFNAGIWEHVNDVDGPPTNQLATQSWNYKRSTWYTVTITVDQNTNTINCTWESQAGIELDITATMPSPSGSVGFWLSHQDNFKGDLLEVRSLGPPDNEPPVVGVQDPQNITYSISDVPLNYVASDNVGLSGCSYELDGVTTPLPNCQNTILSSLTLQSHNVKVIATDTSNNIGESSLIQFTVTADTSPPQWNPVPENIVLLEGQSLFYDADATDNVAVDFFSIDDTTNFKINSSTGVLENTVPLSIGTYPLSLSVSDTSANVNTISITITVQAVGVTPPGFKVAFIADQGLGVSDSEAVLNVILNEGADMVMHQGDFDYNDDPDAWDAQITSILGPDFPYFASIGNHDDGAAVWPAYQQKLTDRLALVDGAVCTFGTGGIGVKQSCTYNGLFFVISGAGTMGSGHATYIKDEMAQDNSIWRICSWHKNMKAMQVGGKSDSTGWEVYEECRIAGAIIATGHEHSYERTRTLSSIQNQIVDSAWSEANNVRVGEGSTFVFVSGLGGASIRNQDRCTPFTFPYGCNGEWASIYTTDQNANYGALFCSFNVGGQANKAHCYFKDIDGNIPDQFDVTSFMVPPGSPPNALDDTGSTDEDTVLNVAAPGVLGNDSDPDLDPLSVSNFDSTSAKGVTISVNSDGSYNYDPTGSSTLNALAAGESTTDTFSYIVSDGNGGTDSAIVTVTVDGLNDSPTADNQIVTTPQDTSIIITLTGSDVDGNSLTFAIVDSPTSGSLSGFEPTTGLVTYSPNPGFFGTDSLTFVVNDGLVNSNTATVSITVEETNVAPVLDPIGDKTTDELTQLSFTATATDSNIGQSLSFSLGGIVPAGASITIGGLFSWTPLEDQGPGSYTFDVVVTDNGLSPLSDSETITVTVNEVNDTPVADSQSVTTTQDVPVDVTLTGNDSDIPTQPLTFSIVSNPTSGTLSGTAPDVTYTPTQGYTGPDSFEFIVNDGVIDSNTATVSITVNELPSSQQLFFDDFDDNNLSEYQQIGGSWSTVLESGRGHVLRQTGNAHTIIFPPNESFNGGIQVKATIWNEDNDAGGLAFRVNTSDGDNFYSCSATSDSGFNAGIWQHVNDLNGTPTNQLAGQPWNYERSRWYDVTVTIDQGLINCIWKSQEAGIELDVTATDPNPAATGSVGIWLSSQDNFKGDLLEVTTLGPPPPVSSSPTANAGPDQTVSDNDGSGAEIITLDGTGSSDPDGTISSYEWKEGAIVLGTTATITPSFSVGTHTVELTVTDNDGKTGTDTVVITVNELPSSQQLYFDNFDDGDISEYQQFGGGSWSTVSEPGRGDVLRRTSNSNSVIFPQSESFSNSYQVIAEIWNEDNDAGGLAFGIDPTDPDNLYSCSATADGGFNAGIWQHVNDVNGAPTTQLDTQPWSYERSRWYTVTVTVDVDSNTINCVWESQEAGIELDVTATLPTPAGSVGFWLSHQDNFKGDLLEVRSN